MVAAGFDIQTVINEELTLFEYFTDADGPEWQRSETAFVTLLQSLGLPANKAVIRQAMDGFMAKDGAGNYVARRFVRLFRSVATSDRPPP